MLDRELAAAHRAGLRDVERIGHAPLLSFDTGPCLRFSRQAEFHPLKYLAGLADAIKRTRGRIFTGTHAQTIEGGKPARIKTSSGRTVTAEAVVVATNTPINDLVAIHTKQAPYVSYVIGATVPRGAVPAGTLLGHARSLPLRANPTLLARGRRGRRKAIQVDKTF